ncbi:uncharacterized protein LOC127719472 isoform X1 [Mytilus californianus]|uniref:uncharacterized protein LOC127719472 isoform X1 n=1 Tax=Mytilus californianus TaxID=6549 RepID=UPI002248627E|nr:uncharacterized protein LOC127719472 isoform X1 [Mytilus californianus]
MIDMLLYVRITLEAFIWILYRTQLIYSFEIKYLGCYLDDSNRMLDDDHHDDKMRLEMCKQSCNGHRYLGLQNSNQCFCGDSLGDPNVYKKKNVNECNKPCRGNLAQICGDSWRNSVYEFITATVQNTNMATLGIFTVTTTEIITLGQSEVTTTDMRTPGKSPVTTLRITKPGASEVTTTEITASGQLEVTTTDMKKPGKSPVTTLQVREPRTSEVTTIKMTQTFGKSEVNSVQPIIPLECLCPRSTIGKGKWDFLRGMTLTLDQLREKLKPELELMKKELSVNKSNTTRMRRSKVSAPDDRVSATSVGYVGVIIICLITILIVFIDILGCFVAKFKRCS